MFSPRVAAIFLVVFRYVAAQQPGTQTKEAKPSVPLQHCTKKHGCVDEPAAVVMDANWRWIHNVDGFTNCLTNGQWSAEFCPNATVCAEACAIEGIDAQGYEETYGVKNTSKGVDMSFISKAGGVGSRIYLTDGDESYKVFRLKNREFTVDVDTSTLPCGMNGALYFVEMDGKGDKGGGNAAGAEYGTGYCDAQCPKDQKWTKGEANMDGKYGMCCTELDIWEANSRATAYTAHPCNTTGSLMCDGPECGDGDAGERYMGVCDKDGCDYNAYRMGDHSFYGAGPDFAVDSSKPVTVVTQFITEDGTDDGDLIEIVRFYMQDGNVIHHANTSVNGTEGDSLTDEYCSAMKDEFNSPDDFKAKGGMKAMGESLDRGLVLALSIWDAGDGMLWLDSTSPKGSTGPGVVRGPCDGDHSDPGYLQQNFPEAKVSYNNIRYGEIGSTTADRARRLDGFFV